MLLVALGGCFSERSGIINIGLEGIMVIGALGGVMVLHNLSPQLPGIVILLLTVAASIAAGMIYSLLLCRGKHQFQGGSDACRHCNEHARSCACNRYCKGIQHCDNIRCGQLARIAFVENKKLFALVEGTEFNWFMILAFAALLPSAGSCFYKTRFDSD